MPKHTRSNERRKKTPAQKELEGIGMEVLKSTKSAVHDTRKIATHTTKAAVHTIDAAPQELHQDLAAGRDLVGSLGKATTGLTSAIGKNLPYLAAAAGILGIGIIALKF